MNEKIKWMEEIVEDVPTNKTLFKLFKFLTGRRKKGITYKELYVIYTNMYNFKKSDILIVRQRAMENVLAIYYYNNKKLTN